MKKRIMAVMLSVFLLTGNIPVTAAENTETIEMSDASETDATEAADGSTEEDTSAGNTENTDDTQQNTGENTEKTPPFAVQAEEFLYFLQMMLPQQLFRLFPQLIADGLDHYRLFHQIRQGRLQLRLHDGLIGQVC